MEEQRVIGTRILHQPVHSPKYVCLGRLAHRILLVISQEHHVLASIAEVLVQVGRHVLDVVDTAAQLTFLAEIIDTNQQGLSLSCTAGVLEAIALGSAVTEGDGVAGRGKRTAGLTVGLISA